MSGLIWVSYTLCFSPQVSVKLLSLCCRQRNSCIGLAKSFRFPQLHISLSASENLGANGCHRMLRGRGKGIGLQKGHCPMLHLSQSKDPDFCVSWTHMNRRQGNIGPGWIFLSALIS